MKYDRLIQPPESRAIKSGRVILEPGEEVGEHVTEKKEEIIIVLKGNATLLKEGKEYKISEGQTHFIKENTKHNIINNSEKILEYVFTVSLFQ